MTIQSRVRLGVAPIGWSNDDMPELGGDTPLETCLAEARAAGFCGIEAGGKFPRDAAVLRPLLGAHDLALSSGWFSGLLRENGSVEEEMRRMRAQLETFAALGTDILFYAETTGSVQALPQTPLSRRPRMPQAEFAPYGEALTALARRMESDYGVRMAYHHHMGTVVETESEVDWLMAATGEEVGLLVDSGHLIFADGDPVAVIRRHAARVRYLHCKDLRAEPLAAARARDDSFMRAVLDGVFTTPGDGFIDFDSFVAAAAAIGYRGWLVVEAEQDPAKYPALEYSRRGGECLRACCARAGIEIDDGVESESESKITGSEK